MRHFTARNRGALALLSLLVSAPACESPLGACTTRGCSSGLLVRLNEAPTSAFRVEVFAGAPDESPSYVYECTPGANACLQDVFFTGLIATHPFIRVTTAQGTVLHEVPNVVYESYRPNGPGCGDVCHTAETSVALPAVLP
jgi:hypothetical protein